MRKSLPIPDDHLALIYQDRAMSIIELAEACEVSCGTIKRRLVAQNISIHPPGRPAEWMRVDRCEQ